jgi:hypothetical protein
MEFGQAFGGFPYSKTPPTLPAFGLVVTFLPLIYGGTISGLELRISIQDRTSTLENFLLRHHGHSSSCFLKLSFLVALDSEALALETLVFSVTGISVLFVLCIIQILLGGRLFC